MVANCVVQEISILPTQKGLELPGGWGGSVRPQNLKECMKLNWNFQGGGRVWNYTLVNFRVLIKKPL